MNEVGTYISIFPNEVQEKIQTIRDIVKKLAPSATERICMSIPTFDLNGKWFVHFAGFEEQL